MCTVVFFNQVRADYPVVFATNRDEIYARPARPPEVLLTEPRAVGGIDEIGGGTWLAVLASGAAVGLTNQRGARVVDPSLRSRGQLVVDVARTGSADAARRLLAEVDPRRYSPFNFFIASAEGVTVGYGRADAERMELADVPPGIHVLANDRLDAPLPKVERARQLAERLAGEPWPALRDGLAALLADHHQPDPGDPRVPAVPPLAPEQWPVLQSLCIHTPHYGTRSAAIVALAPGRVAHYEHADGPPCQAPFSDGTGLLSR